MTDIKPAITDLPDASPSDPLEALSWLGETVEEIAEGLRARGIKGRQRIADRCPLANYLKLWYKNPSVWGEVSVIDGDYDFHAPTPVPTFSFAVHFDEGKFPDLIEP